MVACLSLSDFRIDRGSPPIAAPGRRTARHPGASWSGRGGAARSSGDPGDAGDAGNSGPGADGALIRETVHNDLKQSAFQHFAYFLIENIILFSRNFAIFVLTLVEIVLKFRYFFSEF
mgnify:CR=1 FL=1